MHTLKTTKIVSAAFISLILSACGGGSSSPLDPKPSSSSTSLASSSFSSGAVDTTSPVAIGRGDGSSFVANEIAVSHTTEQIPAGGATTLTVSIVSSTNTLVTAPIQVTFNSRCYAAGEATLSVGAGGVQTNTNKVTTENGQASITYTAKGCVGDDEVTATASLQEASKVARKTLVIAQDTIQAIQFTSATPDKIFLKDSGGAQVSLVRFTVLGNTGAPIKDVPIAFALSTDVGGIQLTNTTAVTDKAGIASTTVQAGTIPTAVEIIATESVSKISGRSNKLSIGTGMPDQKSFSIAASRFNPPGWNRDGETVNIVVRMADTFNNPPPDNTSVQFTTEGGVIDPSCTTENGECTVVWKSQTNRPSNGRVTIRATTLGNESFGDKDSDGLYTPGVDTFNTFNPPSNGNCDPNVPVSTAESNGNDSPCDDLGEAYTDKNENGVWDSGEEFLDLNGNKTYDKENGQYNGVLCTTPGNGCTRQAVNIRQDIVLVMASDRPYSENGLLIGQPDVIEMGANESYSFNVTLADLNLNSMPIGTTVSLITATASDVTINHNMPSSGVANTTSPTMFTVTLKASKTERPSGSFSIAIKSPYLETAYTTRIVPKPLDNTSAKFLGKGAGNSFQAGAIDVGIGSGVLAPNGSTTLSVNLVDSDGNITSGNATVNFTSPCVTNGTAILTNAAGVETTSISTQTGRASITYKTNGCTGEDVVTATADLASLLVNTATATLNIVNASAQNIAFDKAEPAQISLKGAGGAEISTVSFKVNGQDGLGMAGVPVTLTLNNTTGGVCIINNATCVQSIQVTSDANGYVSARVQAGTISTTVRVTASAQNNSSQTIATQSSRLVISTGIPDQDSISLAASERNPPGYIEGYAVDVTVRLADAFNNPVPVDTTVSFTASGGLIEDSCETNEFSTCTVKWFSQSPYPISGKVTILATTVGNESFIDTNGNGQYDLSDKFATSGSSCNKNAPTPSLENSNPSVACDDVGEAYLDKNQNGVYDLTEEFFIDLFGPNSTLGQDGEWTAANGKYDGALCPVTGTACTKNSVTVRADLTLVLSSLTVDTIGGTLPGQPGSVTLGLASAPDGDIPLAILLRDINGNSLPSGTKVTIDTSDVTNATVTLNPNPVVVSARATGATPFNVNLEGDASLPASGSFRIVVEIPAKGTAPGSTTSYKTRINN
ncbi:MAG: hypothetical protein B0W54_18130 [Cellvibrio sp. 79]|nr:MAG: hypothetical protein B0W54_18130 [Cellvibrio sp. 79]